MVKGPQKGAGPQKVAGPKTVRIKNEEQVKKKKRKRPETDKTKDKRKKLNQLKDDITDIRSKDLKEEKLWSAVNIEDEKSLMAMGLASFEVLSESEFEISRPGKRKKTTPPKNAPSENPAKKKAAKEVKPKTDESVGEGDDDATCKREKPAKLSLEERKEKKKERLKAKKKEKNAKLRQKRRENPDPEKDKIRKDKLKEKRKVRRNAKGKEKQLQAELDHFIAEKKGKLQKKVKLQSVTKEVAIKTTEIETTEIENKSEFAETVGSITDNENKTGDPVEKDETREEEESNVVQKIDESDNDSKEEEAADKEAGEEAMTGVEVSQVIEEEAPEVSQVIEEEAPEVSQVIEEEAPEMSQVIEEEAPEVSQVIEQEAPEVSQEVEDELTVKLPEESNSTDAANDEKSAEEEAMVVGDEMPGESKPAVVELTDEEKERGKAWLDMDVCEPIVKALLELDFKKPTLIQQSCIPAGLLRYKDVIGAAETGSGKTLAFGIPLLQRVMKMKSNDCVRGLVLCPTRELALQVSDHLKAAAKYTGVRIVPIVGGVAAPKQARLLSYKPPILVATPGRLWQLIQEHEYLQDLGTVKFIVIDEADRMVEDGHFEEVTQIISRLPGPESRNAFLFSATLSFTIDRLNEKAKKKQTKKEKRAEKKGDAGLAMLVKNIGVKEKVEKVDFTQKKGTAELLSETYFLCNVEDKDLHLYYLLLNHPGKTLVFANSIDNVMNLVHIMKLLNMPVFALHSSLQQRQRFKFLDKFKEHDDAVMICTDIAARGLDIPLVETVIHYQLPPTKEAYIHRSGRTARADNPGLSIAMVGPKDFKSYKKIATQMSDFPIENNRLRTMRPALSLAREIFKIERLKTRPEKKEAKLVALAKEADLQEGEDEKEDGSSKREVKILKAKLRSVLQQPVIDPLNSVRYATTKGAVGEFQTLSTFSMGVPALEHSNKKKRKKSTP